MRLQSGIMDVQEIVSGLEARAKAAGLSIDTACRRAGFHPSTFYRWRNGETSPQFRLLQKLDDAIIVAERERPTEAA